MSNQLAMMARRRIPSGRTEQLREQAEVQPYLAQLERDRQFQQDSLAQNARSSDQNLAALQSWYDEQLKAKKKAERLGYWNVGISALPTLYAMGSDYFGGGDAVGDVATSAWDAGTGALEQFYGYGDDGTYDAISDDSFWDGDFFSDMYEGAGDFFTNLYDDTIGQVVDWF